MFFCSSQPPMVHWLSCSIFPCSSSSRYGDIRPNLRFFNIYRHKSLVLTQFHLIPISTKLVWPSTKLDLPSTTKYQPVPPFTDPVPSYIKQYHSILTQYQQVSTSTPLYCCYLRTTDSYTVYPGSCHSSLGSFLSLSESENSRDEWRMNERLKQVKVSPIVV